MTTPEAPALPVVAWLTKATLDGKKTLERGECATNPDYVKVHKEWDWQAVCDHATATATIQAIREELAEVRRDAERYDWIRANTSAQRDKRGRKEFVMPDPHPLGNIMQGSVAQHLDAAIDSARSTGAGE